MKASKPIIILTLLIIVSLSLAGSGFYFFAKEQVKNSNLQTELESVKAKQRVTESKLDESKKSIAELESKLIDSKSQAEKLSAALEEERSSREETQATIGRLTEELAAQKRLKSDLEAVLKQTQEELTKIKTELKELGSEKEALEGRMRELGVPFPGVELGKIIVSPEAGMEAPVIIEEKPAEVKVKQIQPLPAAIEGKILVVNKDYNFAVVNLGRKDGLEIGDIFSVFHEDKYVGDVKVEKLHDSMAAAGFVSADIKDRVSEGDKVVQKGR
ncbi:MAG: hypothetical protein QME65_03090 [Candidatus Omnitrophota bacterium]|nr:hypothetical protein [Candidatus Omnitrophota bacterium]